jgi:hypothetical protein
LDHPTEFYPRLIGEWQTVPFLEHADVQSGGEEEADRVHHDLPIGVWVPTDDRDLSAIFDAAK